MTILSSELLFYKSKIVASDSTNGGRMSVDQVVSGVVNNVWPHVLKAERDAGSTLYRKLFAKVANDADETLLSATIWDEIPTDGDDWIILFAATQRDTQADITGSERMYGCGTLNTDVSSSSSTMIVDVEDSSIVGIFADGDTVRITDKATPTSATGNEKLLTISGTPTVSGTTVTITVSEAIGDDYTVASGTRVMSIYSVGDIKCSYDNWVDTSSGGTYDEGSYPPVLDNIGTVEETWTLTFTDATNFTVVGDSLGPVGSGTTGADFAPVNSDFAKPHFTLEYLGFAGTREAGDTIVFQTHPASVPIWLKRDVPAGASSLANNKNTTVLSGESA